MERLSAIEPLTPRDRFETEEEAIVVTEARELLQSLDEEVLRDIFEREFTRAGVEDAEEKLNQRFISFDQIIVDALDTGDTLGTCGGGNITLYPSIIKKGANIKLSHIANKNLEQMCKKYFDLKAVATANSSGRSTRTLFRSLQRLIDAQIEHEQGNASTVLNDDIKKAIFTTLETVHTLVHEEIHAITTEEHLETNEIHSPRNLIYSQSAKVGFRESAFLTRYDKASDTEPVVREHYRRFTGINEGVTELMARNLGKQYLKTILPKSVLLADIEPFYDLIEVGSYNRERWVAEQLVALFSVIAEVPPEVVEKSLFRSYLNGGDFLPEELIAAVRHDIPELGQEQIEQLLLKMQIAISEQGFKSESDIYRIFIELADALPSQKRNEVKDLFQELFYKYSFSKELKDEIIR